MKPGILNEKHRQFRQWRQTKGKECDDKRGISFLLPNGRRITQTPTWYAFAKTETGKTHEPAEWQIVEEIRKGRMRLKGIRDRKGPKQASSAGFLNFSGFTHTKLTDDTRTQLKPSWIIRHIEALGWSVSHFQRTLSQERNQSQRVTWTIWTDSRLKPKRLMYLFYSVVDIKRNIPHPPRDLKKFQFLCYCSAFWVAHTCKLHRQADGAEDRKTRENRLQ